MQERRQRRRDTAALLGAFGILIAATVPGAARVAVFAAPLPYSQAEGDDVPSVALSSPVGPLRYTPGRGLQVGNLPLTIGGYSNVNLVRDEGAPAQLELDDLSFFVIADPLARLHLFAELEFEDLLQVDDRGHGGTNNHVFIAERLYADLTISDQLNLRAGKFLTPVGRWNVIHAQPLVWTTSRPLATLLPFDRHVTGAMLFGSVFPEESNWTYSLFGQFVTQLDRVNDEPHPADRSGGARLEYAGNAEWAVGASYLGFRHADHWEHLVGVDTLLRHGPFEVMGEAVVEEPTRGLGTQWGFYVQNVLEVRPRTYLVGRYEHFDQRAPDPAVNLVIPGLAYKPVPFIVLKAEYVIADHRAAESPPGFKSSFAILF